MSVSVDVISIGCLSRNRLWNEKEPVRAGYATTTLVRDGVATVLVDPSLPAELLKRLLSDRTGLTPEKVDTVFLTTFRPVHRRSLSMFERASWLMCEGEIDAVRAHLTETQEQAGEDPEVGKLVQEELDILTRVRPAPDKITPLIHLFPVPGPSPGSAGLLLPAPDRTIVVAGDAVLTREHFERAQVFDRSYDLDKARESFAELAEIADILVPGHDNLFVPIR